MRQSELPLAQLQQSQCSASEGYAAETQYRNLLLSGRKKVGCSTLDSRLLNTVFMKEYTETLRPIYW